MTGLTAGMTGLTVGHTSHTQQCWLQLAFCHSIDQDPICKRSQEFHAVPHLKSLIPQDSSIDFESLSVHLKDLFILSLSTTHIYI
jgi:hypothetical protein